MNFDTILDFIVDNYIWFICGGAIFLLAAIGFAADKSKSKKNATVKETSNNEVKDEINNGNQDNFVVEMPKENENADLNMHNEIKTDDVQFEQPMDEGIVDSNMANSVFNFNDAANNQALNNFENEQNIDIVNGVNTNDEKELTNGQPFENSVFVNEPSGTFQFDDLNNESKVSNLNDNYENVGVETLNVNKENDVNFETTFDTTVNYDKDMVNNDFEVQSNDTDLDVSENVDTENSAEKSNIEFESIYGIGNGSLNDNSLAENNDINEMTDVQENDIDSEHVFMNNEVSVDSNVVAGDGTDNKLNLYEQLNEQNDGTEKKANFETGSKEDVSLKTEIPGQFSNSNVDDDINKIDSINFFGSNDYLGSSEKNEGKLDDTMQISYSQLKEMVKDIIEENEKNNEATIEESSEDVEVNLPESERNELPEVAHQDNEDDVWKF